MTGLLVILGLLLLIPLLYLLAIMPRLGNAVDGRCFCNVSYAHRGLYDNTSAAPENSIAAMKKAVENGYGIEIDVQLTKDLLPVVFHDFTLERMARYDKGQEAEGAKVNKDGSFGVKGRISDYTYAELRRFHLLHSKERIPLLTEVLKTVAGRVPLIIEIKSENRDMRVCDKTQRLLRAYGGNYCIESFNPLVLLWYKKHFPKVFRGQLSDAFSRENENYQGIRFKLLEYLLLNFLSKPDFIAYNHKYAGNLSRNLCCNLFQAKSCYYTIRSQAELNALRREAPMLIFEGFLPDT